MPKRTDWNKLYVVCGINYAEINGEYSHPEIRVGYASGSDQKFWHTRFGLAFQVNLRGTDLVSAYRAYGGTLNASLEYMPEAAKILRAALSQANTLAPTEPCELTRILVGLRASGFREAHITDGAVGHVS